MVLRTLPPRPSLPVGAVMSGGGARAAYQVGVLRAIAAMLPRGAANPFAIICGTSAGAINATSLASNADRFAAGVARLAKVWGIQAVLWKCHCTTIQSGLGTLAPADTAAPAHA